MVDFGRIPYLLFVMVSGSTRIVLLFFSAWVLIQPRVDAQDPQSPFFDSAIQNILSEVVDTSVAGYIGNLQSFGTRHWGNANRDSVARWVQAKFHEAGIADVVIDIFQFSGTQQRNVIATIPGSAQLPKEIIFGAHTDAATLNPLVSPGADDNASGVAAILEIARVLHRTGYQPTHTLRFIGFGAEEAGLRGSADYAAKAVLRAQPIEAMINFDMIGYLQKGTTERPFHVVKYVNGLHLASLDSLMAKTYTNLTPIVTTDDFNRSDSYSFSLWGFPSVFLHDGGYSTSYHTQFDIIDSLDLTYAVEIIRTGLATALTLDGQDTTGTDFLVPRYFTLHQNYPNPFNPTTTITFNVAHATRVVLRVFDIMGRAVETLVDGYHEPGTYTVMWNAQQVSAGVYFCHMATEGRTLTRRMVLVK
jgi:Zn-dependent M28 family amino/carboxypeptidase